MMDAASRAQERARALQSEGHLRDAALYQINGLEHDPSATSLLAEHVALVFSLVQRSDQLGDLGEAVALLDELEGRLSSLITRVDPDQLTGVRAHLDGVEARRRKLHGTRQTQQQKPDTDESKLASAMTTIARGTWDGSVPAGAAAASQRLTEVANLLELADEREQPIDATVRARLVAQNEALRRAVTVDETCREVDEATQSAEREADLRVRLAVLQQAESSLRGLLPTLRALDEARQQQTLKRLDRVTVALDAVVTSQRAIPVNVGLKCRCDAFSRASVARGSAGALVDLRSGARCARSPRSPRSFSRFSIATRRVRRSPSRSA